MVRLQKANGIDRGTPHAHYVACVASNPETTVGAVVDVLVHANNPKGPALANGSPMVPHRSPCGAHARCVDTIVDGEEWHALLARPPPICSPVRFKRFDRRKPKRTDPVRTAIPTGPSGFQPIRFDPREEVLSMTEATVGDAARTVNGNPGPPTQLHGLPRGLYCRAIDVMEWMRWSRETWGDWREKGMRTDYPGTKAEHVLTDWVIDFLCDEYAKKKGKK